VEIMYRQIKVHSDDWNFQRVLWFDQSDNIAAFQLTTVTYGLACAPFLALRTLLQLVKDHGDQYPLAVPSLTKGRYVDDIFGGADSIQQAQEIVTQLNNLCMAGGFPLQKWFCNHPELLAFIQNKKILSSSVAIEDNTMVNILGLFWQPLMDTFQFQFKNISTGSVTKRSILSTIAKCFDPLGFLSPISIKAKILLQELWSLKLEWDDPLPSPLSAEWINFLQDLQEISSLTFPRWLGSTSDTKLEIHGFCDASQRAMAAVVYLRATSPDGNTKVTLVCAKTKVAPLKRLTIPRLELAGAVLLTKLTTQHPSKWKEFVQNRVCFIQETLPHALWKFVSGKENPADLATRGLSSVQLKENPAWLNGPLWLSQLSSFWPTDKFKTIQRVHLEERKSQVLTNLIVRTSEPWDLLLRYSSLTKLFRVTALCRRVILRLKKTPDSSITAKPITTLELEEAKLFWIGKVQQTSLHKEIDTLMKELNLSRSNHLVRLVPFLDSTGLLRLGGRLQASLLPNDAKHPLIIPKSSPLSTLIIAEAHQQTLHGGTQATLSFIRQHYWIVGGRTPVRSFILKCVRCARYRQQRAQQLMGQLPAFTVKPSRPFLHTGIDYAGPLILKT
ncbi:PREDICTED: uncharacterized protein LOC105568605, partial [Vollenhovia emeryi]|uniref:uncharacterized protein LOC105568605 n=1 Tax=Vollenhovia emeryi TaxID=411798 RepID=UPI0005F38C5D